MTKKQRIALYAVAGLYFVGMFLILFGRSAFDIGRPYWEQVEMNVNIVPLKTILRYINLLVYKRNVHLIPNAVINLLGNIAAFVPLGFLLPCVWEKMDSFKRLFLFSFTGIFMVELIQIFTLRGSCDIDDLILNLFATILGFFIFRGFKLIRLKGTRK